DGDRFAGPDALTLALDLGTNRARRLRADGRPLPRRERPMTERATIRARDAEPRQGAHREHERDDSATATPPCFALRAERGDAGSELLERGFGFRTLRLRSAGFGPHDGWRRHRQPGTVDSVFERT